MQKEKMTVITNNQNVAIEVLSAQGLFNSEIDEITIESIGSLKHCQNHYDAKITINGASFILYRDFDFNNVNIKDMLSANLNQIEFVKLY